MHGDHFDPNDDILDFDDYHRDVLRTTPKGLTPKQQLNLAALGCAGEAGEVADLAKKLFFHLAEQSATEELADEARTKMVDELGDLLFYVTLGANACGVTLMHVARKNIEKRERRFPKGFDPAVTAQRLTELLAQKPGSRVRRPSARATPPAPKQPAGPAEKRDRRAPPKKRGKRAPAY